MTTSFYLRTSDGQEYPVAGRLRIGRAADSEVLLTDDLASRLHAQVWFDNGRLLVRDERSSNGTFVNGRRLAAGEVVNLIAGDTLRIGSTNLAVAAVATQATAAAVAPVAAAAPPARAAAPFSAPAPGPGVTRIQSAAPAQPPSNRTRNLAIGGCLVLVVLAVCGAFGFLGATTGRPAIATALAQVGGAATPASRGGATPTPAPGTGIAATPAAGAGTYSIQIVSTSAPPTPLAPADYAATAHNLAADLAALNQAQLRFISDATSKSPSLDEDCRTIAASAFKVGLDGETLDRTTAAQDGGSPAAGQMASLYGGLASYGYAQAIDAQNLRASLSAGNLDVAAAVAQVADYGARAWNPDVTDPAVKGNPFIAHLGAADSVPTPAPIPAAGQSALNAALGAQAGPPVWIAAPLATLTRTVSLPLSPVLRDPQDPTLLAVLITPAGQADGAAAQQAAEAGLLRLGAALRPRSGGQHRSGGLAAPAQAGNDSVDFGASMATLLGDKSGVSQLQAYPKGHAAAAGPAPAGGSGGSNLVDTLFGTDDNNNPTQQGQVPVGDEPPLLSLTLSNITIANVNKRAPGSGSFEADATLTFDVTWQTGLVHPQFTLNCNSSAAFAETQSSGTEHVKASALLILFPGTAILYCYANSNNGSSLGSASTNVLVGDPAAATQRANQVNTEAKALELTLTAEANGTGTTVAQHATQTEAVLGTQHALETEQAASQTAEFAATITQIANLTAQAAAQEPSATATFAPVLVETLEHPGTVFAVSTKTVLQQGHQYDFCFSGTVNLINPTKAAKASDIDHVNGVAVPAGGCLELAGTGKVAVISCGSGEVDPNDPGGFTIRVTDLGPT